MLKKLKLFIFIIILCAFSNAFALTQTSVFMPRYSFLESSEINFSVRVKNLQNSFLFLNFNNNCHYRYRVYKDNQLVYPKIWYETCKSFNTNSVLLSKNQSVEEIFKIPAGVLNEGKYYIVNTVNNIDLRQVVSFEVLKDPVLISNLGEICGGFQNIQCDVGLTCNKRNKDENQYGMCEISEFSLNSKSNFNLDSNKSYNDINNSKISFVENQLASDSFVTLSDFYATMYYLNPTKLYSSKSKNFISRQEAVKIMVEIFYGEVPNNDSLDGYIFLDTIFSKYRKEIDFAYLEFLEKEDEYFFRPNDFLKTSELYDWIKSLNNL